MIAGGFRVLDFEDIFMTPTIILYCLLSLLAGSAFTFGLFKLNETKRQAKLKEESERLLASTRQQAETERSQLMLASQRSCLGHQDRRPKRKPPRSARANCCANRSWTVAKSNCSSRRMHLRKQQRGLEMSQTRLATQMRGLTEQRAQLDKTLKEQTEVLEQASGMTREQAAQKLMEALEKELENERGTALLRHKKRLDEVVQAQGREMLLTAIQRYASAHTAESTTSTVDVPTDDMKGRIIGREGRNIRAFEKATGVDVIIDDTPGVVIVSGFDPVRREIARQSLNQPDRRRTHPSLQDRGNRRGNDQEDQRRDPAERSRGGRRSQCAGLATRRSCGCSAACIFVPPTAKTCCVIASKSPSSPGLVAEMLGMDADLARRCGLLHDIGKAADHELEGGHPKIGADLLRRHNEPPEVVHAALGTMTRSSPSIPTRCWLRSGMPAAPAVPGPGGSRWSGTSSGWKSSSRSPDALMGFAKRLRSAPGGSCG